MEFTVITKDQFFDQTGINLDLEAPATLNTGQQAEQFIKDAADDILVFIQGQSPSFDKTDLTTEQNDFINQAVIQQIKYKLKNTDFSTESGINQYTGVVIAKKEIDARIIAPKAKSILKTHIIYNGVY
jgi:hypothetical protein